MRIIRWTSWLVLALVLFGFAPRSFAQVSFGVAITFGPPELPVYQQPLCPGEGYLWTPGYWGWDDDYADYYWVPGTWVEAPRVGFLWTPPYWGWGGDRFVFYDGYWGREVGFYGGIDYGYGYGGRGYEGGRWDNDRFYYNQSVNNINTTNITNVYNTTVINNNTTNVTRVSYNGGNGGVSAQATAKEQAVAHEQHVPPPAPQQQHIQAAKTDPQLRASTNQGKPPIAATAKPAAFSGSGVVAAKAGGHYTPPPNRPAGNANANNANRPNNNNATAQPNNNNSARPAENNANRPPSNTNPANNNARPANNGNNNPNRPPSSTNPGNNNNAQPNNPNRPPDANRPNNVMHPRDLPPPTRQTPNTGNPQRDQQYQQQQDKLIQKQQQERDRVQQQQERQHQQIQQQKAPEARQQQVEQQHQQQTQQLQQKHETQQQHLQQKYSPPPQRQTPPPPDEKKPKPQP